MGTGSGFALKLLQWFVRGIQFCCSALILALYSYFLATLHNHNLDIATNIRAVEGIAGIAVVYTALGILLVCCLAGHPFTSGIAVFLDVAFVAAFIYVAQANRGGASSCTGIVSTPFGTGDANSQISTSNGHGGFTALPSQGQACRMESACLATAIVAIFFFMFSLLIEIALVRHRRKEQRFGPGPQNGYTSGYGKGSRRGGGLFASFRRRRHGTGMTENALPEHTHPDQIRASYTTDNTRVGTAGDAPAATKYGESGYGHQTAEPQAAYPGRNYAYDDGVYNRA